MAFSGKEIYIATNSVEGSCIPTYCEGDINPDGTVDNSDLVTFSAGFGIVDDSSDWVTDLDGDGDVDGKDLAIFAADFGKTDCP